MEYQNLIYEVKNHIAVIRLNRPKAMNSLSMALLTELDDVFTNMSRDRSILGVILTGEGKAFCAGADLTGGSNENASPNSGERFHDQMSWIHSIYHKIENFERPVVAAVNGYALGGGCELSLVCDFRIASERAVFGLPEVGLGVMACYGGPQRLPRVVGAGVAKEMLYTGKKISAQEAKEVGLVNRVVPAENLMEEVMAVMEQIAQNAPISVKYSKICVNKGLEMPLDYALEFERDLLPLCIATEDAQEGMRSFAEKRKPVFRNR